MHWYAYLLIALAVLALAGVGLVAPRLRRRPPLPPTRAPERIPEATPRGPALEPDQQGGVQLPTEAPASIEGAPAPEVELERPEPTAGRLVRLRARLARSQSVLGRGLLAVLARDRLDDDAWEEVEEALITADVGVDATREIVDRLRERTRVLGTRTGAELRALLAEELVAALDPKLDRSLKATPTDGRGGPAGGRRQRRRQDHHLRQDRPGAGRRRAHGRARRRRTPSGPPPPSSSPPGPSGWAPRSSAARRAATRPRSPSTRSSAASRPVWTPC